MRKILVILVLLAFSLNAFALEEKAFKPSFKPDMALFFHYNVLLDNENGEQNNLFEIQRMYLGLKAKPVKDVSFRATMDIAFYSGSDYKVAYLKYGYAEVKNIIPGAKIIFGQQKTGMIDFLQWKLWGHRDILKSSLDYHKFDSSADIGLAIDGKLPSCKLLKYHLGFFAGEGYKKDKEEENQAKALSLRLTFLAKPILEGLSLSLYGKAWAAERDGVVLKESITIGGATLAFDNDLLRAGVDYYLKGTEGKQEVLTSLYGTLKLLPKKLDILVRYDVDDPDTNIANDEAIVFLAAAKVHVTKKTFFSVGVSFLKEKATESKAVNFTFFQKF